MIDLGPELNAVRELRLRALVGVPLFLLGIWLVCYCDLAIARGPGWGWLCFASGCLCGGCSFVLLFYGASLSTLWR